MLKKEDEKWFKLSKTEYCKKKIVRIVLRNNWLKDFNFCDIIICGLHFDRTLRINYEKCYKKYYDQW